MSLESMKNTDIYLYTQQKKKPFLYFFETLCILTWNRNKWGWYSQWFFLAMIPAASEILHYLKSCVKIGAFGMESVTLCYRILLTITIKLCLSMMQCSQHSKYNKRWKLNTRETEKEECQWCSKPKLGNEPISTHSAKSIALEFSTQAECRETEMKEEFRICQWQAQSWISRG